MSKKTVAALANETELADRDARAVSEKLASLENTIHSAMEDKVGAVAERSIAGIGKQWKSCTEGCLATAREAVATMRQGYDTMEGWEREAEAMAANAKSVADAIKSV